MLQKSLDLNFMLLFALVTSFCCLPALGVGVMINRKKYLVLEIFLLALRSVAEDADVIGRHRAVLSALRTGDGGLGSLATRLALKNALENGLPLESVLKSSSSFAGLGPRSLTSSSPGAALWLLRAFLGRLPLPLFIGTRWRQLGKQCNVASRRTCTTSTFGSTSNIKLINDAAKCLQSCTSAERTILKALFELVSNLGGDGPALLALADFFAPSLVGMTSVRSADERLRDVRSLLIFLCCHWTIMFAILGDGSRNTLLLREGIAHGVSASLSLPTSTEKRSFTSSKIQGRQAISWTDARPKRPLVRRIFKQIYEAAENKSATTSSVVSAASATTPTDETPLLWNPDAQIEENVTDIPSQRKCVSQSCVTVSIESLARSQEISHSRCWLKSLFSSRGSSMSSIPSVTSVKYEHIPDKKQTWTL